VAHLKSQCAPGPQRPFDPLVEQRPVGQPGERVVAGAVLVLLRLPLDPPLVADHDEGAQREQEYVKPDRCPKVSAPG
jgi:hypothetical protein